MPRNASNLLRLAFAGLVLIPLAAGSAPTTRLSEPLDDRRIVAILISSNEAGIALGRMASAQTADDDIRLFARHLVVDHLNANQKAKELIQRLTVIPEESAVSQVVQINGTKARSRLSGLKGYRFDQSFIDQQIDSQVATLEMIDTALLPRAEERDIRALLVQSRTMIAAHLEHAEQLQNKLHKRSAGRTDWMKR